MFRDSLVERAEVFAMTAAPRDDLAHRIADEITLSDDPDATLRKQRADFDISQTTLTEQLDVSSSVVSDYESGRRESPDVGVIRRMVEALLDIDEAHGGSRVRQYARVPSAGFGSDIVQNLREYPTLIPFDSFYSAIGATPIVDGDQDRIGDHTAINGIQAIARFSLEEFYRLYGQSASRTLVSIDVIRDESPLVAMRVATPTPNATVLHGLSKDDLWEHAPALVTIDNSAPAVTDRGLDEMLKDLRKLP